MRNVLRLLLPLVVACGHASSTRPAVAPERAPVQQQGASSSEPPREIAAVAASDLGAVGTRIPGSAQPAPAAAAVATRASNGDAYSRDLTALGDFVRSRSAQLDFCYREALVVNPRLAVALTVNATITGDGDVSDVRVLRRSFQGLGTDLLESCVRTKIISWKFPRTDGGTGVYPLSFSFTR